MGDYPRRGKRALGSGEDSGGMLPIDSEMAGSIGLKLSVMVEGMQKNVLAKEFLDRLKLTRGRSAGHRCLF